MGAGFLAFGGCIMYEWVFIEEEHDKRIIIDGHNVYFYGYDGNKRFRRDYPDYMKYNIFELYKKVNGDG